MGKASRRKIINQANALLNVTESRLKALGLGPAMVIRADLPQEQKISNAIGKILDSEVIENTTLDEYRHHVNSIVLAWNVSLLPPKEQAKLLQRLASFAEQRDPSMVQASQALVLRLIEKKQAMFPDDKRFIVSHDVQIVGNKVHVTAAALTAPPEDASA